MDAFTAAEYPAQLSSTPQVSYLTADHLGSPRVITNENGTVTSRKDFDECSESRVNDINRRIISNAENQVYASIRNNELEEMVNKHIGKEFEIKHQINILNQPQFPKPKRF